MLGAGTTSLPNFALGPSHPFQRTRRRGGRAVRPRHYGASARALSRLLMAVIPLDCTLEQPRPRGSLDAAKCRRVQANMSRGAACAWMAYRWLSAGVAMLAWRIFLHQCQQG